jgi:CheY-like chemotaxis protein
MHTSSGFQSPFRRAKVLVVDDQELVRDCVARVLSAGHDVQTASGARAALELIHSGARFDAIMCELTMRDMTGADFHAALLRDAPDQARRLAFLTGGRSSAAVQRVLEASCRPMLEKPFTKAALLDCIRVLRADEIERGARAPER